MKFIYQWRGIDLNGHIINGILLANNKKSLTSELIKQKITLTNIKIKIHFFKNFNLKTKKLHELTYQLYILVKSGISIPDCIKIIQKNSKLSWMLQVILCAIEKNLAGGINFSQALKNSAECFNEYYCSVVQAGEKTGNLARPFELLLQHQEQRIQFITKIKKALLYPGLILASSTLMTFFLLIFILPQFVNIFNEYNAPIPTLTLIILTSVKLVSAHIVMLLIISSLLILTSYYIYCRLEKYRFYIDKAKIHFPIFKQIAININVMKWAQLLAILLEAKIPLSEACSLATKNCRNHYINKEFARINELVNNGIAFNQAIASSHLFADFCIQMIHVGENTASLAEMLHKIFIILDKQVNDRLDVLLTLLEPLLMLALAAIIGTLIIAMYLPIFKMGSIL